MAAFALACQGDSMCCAQLGGYSGPATEPDRVPPPSIVELEGGLGGDAAEALIDEVRRTGGEAVVVLHRGRLAMAWAAAESEPIELMSATKSVIALAIGIAIADGDLASADTPVASVLPGFTGDGREHVTVRMLLNHTSGLDHAMDMQSIYGAEDVFAFARQSPIVTEPGSRFVYNNNACNLLMNVLAACTGQPADSFIASRLLTPLGITNWAWYHDPAGNPHGMAGLKLDAIDAARIGQLVLDDGVFCGRQVVPRAWVRECLEPSHGLNARVGLLWWRAPRGTWPATIDAEALGRFVEVAGLSEGGAEALNLLRGARGDRDGLRERLKAVFASMEVSSDLGSLAGRLGVICEVPGDVAAYYANGYLGQFIVVMPEHEMVFVRQQARREHPEPLSFQRFLDRCLVVAADVAADSAVIAP